MVVQADVITLVVVHHVSGHIGLLGLGHVVEPDYWLRQLPGEEALVEAVVDQVRFFHRGLVTPFLILNGVSLDEFVDPFRTHIGLPFPFPYPSPYPFPYPSPYPF